MRMLRGVGFALWVLALAGAASVAASDAAAKGAPPAPAPFPDTGPGRLAREWFDAYNAERDAAMAAFIRERMAPQALEERPLDERLRGYHRLRADVGRLTPVRARDGTGDAITIVARAESGAGVAIGFRCEPAPPHRLLGMRVEVGVEPGEEAPAAEEGPSPRDDRELAAMLGSRLDSLARAGLFSGAVLVAKDGVPLFRSAAGPADRAAGRANRPDTKFNLGSINKIFTKIAVAQLAQAGRLRLTDTIDRYLPDYPRGAASRITIQHLLEHRGGVADFFGPRYEAADRSKLRRVSDWLPLFRDEPLHFEPGTRQEYSNGGYVLLGAIVERVSGQDYYDYVREHIYHPAGMKDTDHYSAEDAVENLARGFTRRAEGPDAGDGSGLRDNASARPWRGSPAGGGYSTVDDLLRFVQALRGRALLDSTWSAWAGGGGIGIAGGAPGINATLEAEGPYVIAVMANLDPPAAERLAGTIRRWLPEGAGHERRSP